MMGHNIHFKGVIWKIIPKLSLLPLLIWDTGECLIIMVEMFGIMFAINHKQLCNKRQFS